MRQILVNLVGNAAKFTEKGRIVVVATLVPDDGKSSGTAKEWLRFEVRDTGIGIQEDARGRLFEAFSQVDSGASRRFEGSGLGLAISRKIVDLMGGTIGVDSRYGKGSTFWFQVPAMSAGEDSVPSDDNGHLQGMRLLLAGGTAQETEKLLALVAPWGVEASLAGNGDAMLTALRASAQGGRPFDIVVADMDSGEIAGLGAMESNVGLVSAGIVVLWGAHRPDLPKSTRVVGLEKPFTPSSFHDCISRVWTSRKGRCAPSAVPEAGIRGLVLVVDDNDVNLQVARGLLEKMGLTVDVANDGVEAIAMTSRRDYALVFMDIQMPGMDGLAATSAIRQLPGAVAGVPIIAMTANAMVGDRERYISAGMDDYIAKPLDRRRLTALLDSWRGRLMNRDDNAHDASPAALIPVEAQVAEIVAPVAEEHSQLADLLDREALDMLAEDLDLSPLFAQYFEQIDGQCDAVLAAFAAGDAGALDKTAHRLKGASMSLGAKTFGNLCFQIEKSGKAGDVASAGPLIPQLKPLAAQSCKALRAYLGA